MLDIAKEITDYWKEHINIVVVIETSNFYFYKNGIYIPYTDTMIKVNMKVWIDETNEENAGDKEWKNISFSTTLFNQVKNHLHSNMRSLDEFDVYDWRVNCTNGYIDLRDGTFTPHWKFNENPYLSFIQIPVNYNEEAKCPNILRFIIDVFGIDRFPFIYEIIGYMLYKSVKFHKSFIFFGEASSGKTTFIELVRTFLGYNNIQDKSIQRINERFQMGTLRNKLANIYDDLSVKKLKYIQNFKQITTNKTLTSEIKGIQEPITWKNFCKQIYTCNKLPEVNENMDTDFWRRIILIHCTNFFDNGNKDFDIGEKITTGEEKSGLLNMVIHHFKDLYKRKHFDPRWDNIETVKGIWQININPMKLFLDECCIITNNEDDYEEADNFRAQLNAFRKTKNAEGVSMNMITRRLKDMGIVKKQKGDGNRYYIGIRITLSFIDKIDKIVLGEMILDEF